MSWLITNARIVTPAPGVSRGAAMGALRVVERGYVFMAKGCIVEVGWAGEKPPTAHHTFDAGGRVLLPGLVDCHTHSCWAGSRIDEWEQKLRGATYLDLLRAGGGIMSTVRAVRAATQDDLSDRLAARAWTAPEYGVTTLEVKSGYGLSTPDELKMLRAIQDAGRSGVPGAMHATALLGHAIDPDQPDFVQRTIAETLPAVHAEFPGIAVDAYLETGAWTLDDVRGLFHAAAELGHPLRLHADQFTSMGGVGLAISCGARTVDHLEAATPDDIALLASSGVIGVGLPICGLHLDGRYAPLGRIVARGGAVAVATNCNPGSAPSSSLPLAMALAVRHGGLSPAEAITAATSNAAAAMGLADRGAIAPGLRADLVALDSEDERSLTYELDARLIAQVWMGGKTML